MNLAETQIVPVGTGGLRSMTADRNYLAALYFVRDAEDGINEIRRYETARAIIQTLAEDEMEDVELLKRCGHREFGLQLLKCVYEFFSAKDQNERFLRALTQMNTEWWYNYDIQPQHVFSMLRPTDVVYLLNEHRALLVNPKSPMYLEDGAQITDSYWSIQVRQYLARNDFRRAWDELQKAARGYLKTNVQAADFQEHSEFVQAAARPGNRCWRASPALVEALTNELYNKLKLKRKPDPILPAWDALTTHFRTERDKRRRQKNGRRLTEYQSSLPT